MKRPLLGIILFITNSYLLQAQVGIFKKQIDYFNPSLVESVSNHRFTFGDIDNDGDYDMIIGEYQGRLIFYRNMGTSTAPRWKQELSMLDDIKIPAISGPPFTTPHLKDIDGDGDLDLIVGVRGSSSLNDIYFFRNIGSIYVPAWREENSVFKISEGEMAIPFLVDLDNDLDFDMIIGDIDGTLHYYRNTGDKYYPAWSEDVTFFLTPTNIDVGTNSSPTLADLDNDGDFDLAVGAGDGTLKYFENTGTASEPVFTEHTEMFSSIDVGYNCNPTFIDLDGDKDFDLVTGNWEKGMVYFENMGSQETANWVRNEEKFAGLDVGFNSAPAIFDVDNDGVPDLVVGHKESSSEPPLYTFKNQGTAQHPVWKQDVTAFPELTGIIEKSTVPTFVDLDDDGDMDFVSGAWDGRIYYFENTGSPGSPLWTYRPEKFLGVDVGNYSVPFFADLDNDGDFDLSIGEINGRLTHYWNDGNARTPDFNFNNVDTTLYKNIDVGSRSAPALLDIDGDDDLDLIVGTGNGILIFYENTGDKQKPRWSLHKNFFQEIDFDLDWYPIPKIYDLDNDGKDEIIIGEQSGTIKVYWNESSFNGNQGPAFASFSPTVAYDTTSFYITGVITDQDRIYDDDTGSDGQGVYLLWDDDGEIDISANEEQLRRVAGDTFRTINKIPPQFRDAHFIFRVFAYDDNPAGRNFSNSPLYQVYILDDDNNGPIFLFFTPDSVEERTEFYLEVGISDPSGFYDDNTTSTGQGAYIRWDVDNELNITYNEQSLSLVNQNLFRIDKPITGQEIGTTIIYQVYIFDNDYDDFYLADRKQAISPQRRIFVRKQGSGDDDDQGPIISSIQTLPITVYDTTFFDIQATITDPSGVFDDNTGSEGQGISVRWDNDGELVTDFNEAQMSLAADDIYRTDEKIPSQYWGHDFVYQIYAYDNDDDDNNPFDRKLSISALQSVTIVDDDTIPPEFLLITPLNVNANKPFKIKAIITDPSGIYDDDTGAKGQGVYLSWDTDGELANSANEIKMSLTFNDTFMIDTDVPGFLAGTSLIFAISAYDNDFDNNISLDRLRNTSNVRTIVVFDSSDADISGPIFANWQPRIKFDDECFYISGEISDPAGVYDDDTGSEGKGVFLLWDTDGELTMTANEVQLNNVAGNSYQSIQKIPSQPAGMEVVYQVFAYDNDTDAGPYDQSLGISLAYTVQIIDDDDLAPQFSNFSPTQVFDSTEFYIECDIIDTTGVYDDETGSEGYGIYLLMDTDSELAMNAIEVKMDLFSGNRYRTNQSLKIPTQSSGLIYQVFAHDSDYDNENPEDRKIGISLAQAISLYDDDTNGPTFSNFMPNEVMAGDSFFIECEINDPSGIYDDETGSIGQGIYINWDTDGELQQSASELQMEPIDRTRYRTVSALLGLTIEDDFIYQVYAYDNDFDNSYAKDRMQSISVSQNINVIGEERVFRLKKFGVAPNPFRDMTYFIFDLSKEAEVEIKVFTVSGELVTTLENRFKIGAVSELTWSGVNTAGNELASGVYIYRFVANDNEKKIEKFGKIAIVR